MITGTLTGVRRTLSKVLTICVAIVLGAGLAVVWVRVIQTLRETPAGPKTVGQPRGLVWDDRVFTSPAQFSAYLASKGQSYSRWAVRHPTAFDGTAPTTAQPTSDTKPPKTPATHPVASPPLSDTTSQNVTSTLLTAFLLLVGLGLAASAMIPPRYAPLPIARFYARPDRRMVALAAAAAILVAFGVSFFLS